MESDITRWFQNKNGHKNNQYLFAEINQKKRFNFDQHIIIYISITYDNSSEYML